MLRMTFSDVKKFVVRWRKELVGLGVGLAGLGVVALILWLPSWQAEHVRGRLDQPADEYRLATLADEHRRTLDQILGGFGLFVGLYLGWRRVRAAEEGQITEQFTRAIDQLGDNNLAIRLGGIYALERIARDSEKAHGPIMEVLTAYVREKAPRKKDYEYGLLSVEEPPTDIQAILTVIGRRETTGKNRGTARLDLSNTHLVGAQLMRANLSHMSLMNVTLNEADLNEADLSGADLSGADLIWADLSDADLSGADLEGTDLSVTTLSGVYSLRTGQILATKNWRDAFLPDHLEHLPEKFSLPA